MELALKSYHVYTLTQIQTHKFASRCTTCALSLVRVTAMAPPRRGGTPSHRKPPKNLRYPRRPKLPPPNPKAGLIRKNNIVLKDPYQIDCDSNDEEAMLSEFGANENDGDDGSNGVEWNADEIDAISSLFRGRVPQKPGNIYKQRPLPLPLPHKIRPLGLPTSKKHIRRACESTVIPRLSITDRVYKNPEFLIDLAKEIRSLPLEKDVSLVLDKWVRFLRKGSLSLTIRELGHMGLPDRSLQTFCWAQKQPLLFPDDRILASTIEILGRTHRLNEPFDLEKFTSSASRSVIEALARGVIRGGSVNLARKLLLVANDSKRTLDPSIHVKLILELGRDPDKYKLVIALLDELGDRDDINLNQQDCTSVMKVCVRVQKFEIVESLFNWFRNTGGNPNLVMYTTLIHSRYCEKKYRGALAVVWEMEGLSCLFDLPAYRVVIKLFVAMNDLSRAVRYFSKLKEAGFFPTYDIYRDMIKIYVALGRVAKCKDVCREVEMAGFKLDNKILLLLQEINR